MLENPLADPLMGILIPCMYSSDITPAKGHQPPRTQNPRRKSPSRPKPYDVWADGGGNYYSNRAGGPSTKKLSQKGWEDLLYHLNDSDAVKKKNLMRQHHKDLADELRQLSFKPELNKNSVLMASQIMPLSARRSNIIKAHEDYVSSRREASMKKMMEGCTFKPSLQAGPTTNAYLEKAGMTRRTVDDYFKYEADVRVRRLQRKQKMDEVAGRELTFTPQLSRNSAIIHTKLKKTGKIAADPVTGQTLTRGRPAPTYTTDDAGHEEETFEPNISSRSVSFKHSDSNSVSVYQRLYESGMVKTIRQHNKQVATYRERFRNYPTRTYEIAAVEGGDKAAWVEEVQRRKRDGMVRSDQAFLNVSDEPTVHVIPYSTKYDGLIRNLRPDFLPKAA